MENTKKSKTDEWKKVSSKSRPGRFYMFNPSTGETKWLSELQNKETNVDNSILKKESTPRIIDTKHVKTPAQDRLKRLQHAIKTDQTKKPTGKVNRRPAPEFPTSSRSKKQQENISTDITSLCKEQQENLSTAKTSIGDTLSKSPHKRTAHLASPTKEERKKSSTETPSTLSKSRHQIISPAKNTNSSPSRVNKRLHRPSTESLTNEKLRKITDYQTTASKSARLGEETATDLNLEVVSGRKTNSTSASSKSNDSQQGETQSFISLGAGIVNKIKNICQLPFRSSNKRKHKDDNSSKLRDKPSFKPERKNEKKPEIVTAAVQQALYELREEQNKITKQHINSSTTADSTLNQSSQQSTPKHLNIPCYQKGSANSRLDRLRQSLLNQNVSTSPSSNSFSDAIGAPLTPTLSKTLLPNSSTYSIYQTANNTINDDEDEPMDWQEILQEETKVIPPSEANIVTKHQDVKLSSFKEAKIMGDIYDAVNENLLRMSAEKRRDLSKNKTRWLKDFYYFVVDTNVLLKNLTFLEDLTKLKLCDTKGSMLYIPYSVLQELDKLKMRSGCQEGVKTLAVRAIKYLNKKFENNSQHLLAQTALEERDHIIDINSADDSIINCCLQAKSHVPNILLLTEDVNLRNKAICNNILVSTKSDLVSKHYDGEDSS